MAAKIPPYGHLPFTVLTQILTDLEAVGVKGLWGNIAVFGCQHLAGANVNSWELN